VSPDALLVESVDSLLDDVCDFSTIEQAEIDGWCAPIWDALADGGFCTVSLPESAGGSGGSLVDALAVLQACGRRAAPVPVAETAVLGGWLLTQAGLELPPGPITVVPDPHALHASGGRLCGHAVVAWARGATAIAALYRSDDRWRVACVQPEDVRIVPGTNLAGEARDTVDVDASLDGLASANAPADIDGDALVLRGALSRVALMAGAAETLLRLTVDYTHERHQFGQPIARFQAVQHHLVTVAQGSVRLSMAADVAARAASEHRAEFEIAAAKVIAGEVATDATRSAHQAHGAMGVTREYGLHHFSRRLWAWRHEYGGARAWRRRLGGIVADGGADLLFETISR
jgi:acyl-CoA dehydrogenase